MRQRYVASFGDKCAELESGLIELSSDDNSARARLRGLAHKISGSAGMYGFDDLGHTARDLVHVIDGGSDTSSLRELVQRLIAGMATE